MKKVLVTGAAGQLGTSIRDISKEYKQLDFTFKDSKELNITDVTAINVVFENENFDFCINCAAYTFVDKAESEKELAEQINTIGPKNLAHTCKKNKCTLIHISTDFVFDGKQLHPYNEEDKENPVNVYGLTKLNGEKEIAKTLKEHIIIRTSWLYSEFGNNFLKTILRLSEEKKSLNIVKDQIGTPTYAGDLGKVILKFIVSDFKLYGTYHYSNEGMASWYDFAKVIVNKKGLKTKLFPIKAENYSTSAQRPKYSVLDKSRIKKTLKLEIPNWEDSLTIAISKLIKY
ncbi:dTDP-4-dehydrorhamnose reductase [Croceitalea sp. MTPC9]|uniref:dTDP-4-dehydrorhamnose reductase n=1 Tax=unclassified Croceitalea TaxID=2632280 RepID=UPI002B3790C4|nr:dTDP-4-dehydrorhamnose reductase [Croceitalea sp. MTPC6]GMN16595.1 dTDP-4-dehydrorhamnose reductase [Croceitalea sp. MTPC9]